MSGNGNGEKSKWLPKKYPIVPLTAPTVLKTGSFVLQVDCAYIRNLYITWNLVFKNECKKYQLVKLVIFCIILHTG